MLQRSRESRCSAPGAKSKHVPFLTLVLRNLVGRLNSEYVCHISYPNVRLDSTDGNINHLIQISKFKCILDKLVHRMQTPYELNVIFQFALHHSYRIAQMIFAEL